MMMFDNNLRKSSFEKQRGNPLDDYQPGKYLTSVRPSSSI